MTTVSELRCPDWLRADENTNEEEHQYLVHCLRVAILVELTDKQRDYLLDYMQGLNMPQIAEKFGVNKSTVSREIGMAKRTLEKVLKYASPKLLKGWLRDNGYSKLVMEEE